MGTETESKSEIDGAAGVQATASLATARAQRDRERPLVLVIEDNPDDWEIYGKILYYNGYDVMCASDGETGYRMVRAHQPDLILLDLVVPKLDGLSLCQRLLRDPSQVPIPVVVVSACPEREFGPRALAMGCARYLEKPTRPVQLLHEVEALIGRPPPPGVGRPPLEYPAVA